MTSLYTRLISGLVFPLHERLKHHTTVAVRKHQEVSQWWSPQQIRDLQLDRLRDLLRYCSEHVPYYRELIGQCGIDHGNLSGLSDLRKVPFLTKELIRQNSDALRSDIARDLGRFNTGGSSGEPLVFYIGNRRVSHDVAAKWRATRWWGVDIGDPEIVIWGSPIELGSQDRIRAIRDRLLRTQLLSAFEMSDRKLDTFVATIQQVGPRMLFGYPSALALIARHARKQGVAMDGLGIRVAFVTSERLYDDQRADIEQVFGCPVANGYGGRDAGFIAHQCPHGGMHITAEDIIVELIGKDDQPVPDGEPGEIVVTHLATHEYPFIRYRTGDVAVMSTEQCACGRGLPMLKEIQGRTTDFIVARDGTIMHGLALIYVIRDVEGVETFKIVQEDRDHLQVLLVTNDRFRDGDLQTIYDGLAERMGAGVSIDVDRVDQIPPEASGKYRYIVSKVAVR